MSISHKKMSEIKNRMNEIFDDTEELKKDLFYDFLKNKLNYNEECGSYSKEHYEKYRKKYIDNNREYINKKNAEYAKNRYNKNKLKKNENDNIT
jgi:hypothetical protein